MAFKPPESFDFSRPEQWPAWRQRFLRFRTAAKLTEDAVDVQISALIYSMGPDAEEIYNTFDVDENTTFEELIELFDGYFTPKTCAVGLNFASEDGKLQERATRRREKKRQSACIHGHPPARPPNNLPGPPQNDMMQSAPIRWSNLDLSSKKMTKVKIGAPTEFRHVSHVGWDPNKGFDMNSLDPDMKQLFSLVGINKEEEIDKDTVDFIYDFVEKSGGMEVLKNEMKQRPPPSAPPSDGSRGLPPPPNRSPTVPPSPSPTRPPPSSPTLWVPTPRQRPAPRRSKPPPPRAPTAAAPPPPPAYMPRPGPPPPSPFGRSMPPHLPPSAGAPPPPTPP